MSKSSFLLKVALLVTVINEVRTKNLETNNLREILSSLKA